jgi:uncharacterized RDD family membrane protein YckC
VTTPEEPVQPPQFGNPEYGAPQPYSSSFGQPSGPPAPYYGQSPYPPPARPYASWLQRVGATLIDGLVIGVPGVILVFIGLAIGHGIGEVLAVLAYLAIIAVSIWNVVFRQGRTGQTIGKSQIGIRLVREIDGQVVGPGMSFVRQIAHFLDGLVCDIGYLWPLWDPKRQTFADKICGTIVIQA